MTDIVPTPAAPSVPVYPALGSASFNTEAYAYGSAMPGVSYRIWEIGVTAQTNATSAQESAQIAVGAASTSTSQADLAMGYRNQASASAGTATDKAAQAEAAAGQAVPAAAVALDAAQRAEAAAASIEDGPVTSVNGQTGVVDLTAELHALALLF